MKCFRDTLILRTLLLDHEKNVLVVVKLIYQLSKQNRCTWATATDLLLAFLAAPGQWFCFQKLNVTLVRYHPSVFFSFDYTYKQFSRWPSRCMGYNKITAPGQSWSLYSTWLNASEASGELVIKMNIRLNITWVGDRALGPAAISSWFRMFA